MADVRKIIGGLSRIKLPPAENSRLTQIATTGGTYEKARDLLDAIGATRRIDYGAGKGHGANIIGGDSFEPFAPPDFNPTFRKSADIPSEAYDGLTNLNVLNVLDPRTRDEAVEEIGRILRPGGTGIITTRGKDVMSAKGVPGEEPMSLIIGEGDRARYQKGFRQDELLEYLSRRLGSGFDLQGLPLGAAGARVDKKARGGLAQMNQGGRPRPKAPASMVNYLKEIDPAGTLNSVVRDQAYKNKFGHSVGDISSMTHKGEGAAAPNANAETPYAPLSVDFMGHTYQAPIQAPKAISDTIQGASEFVLPQSTGDLALGAALGPWGKALGTAGRVGLGATGAFMEADEAQAGFGGLRRALTGQRLMARRAAEKDITRDWDAKLLEEGRATLWEEDGVYKGPDGLWRFEFDDSKAKLLDLPSRPNSVRRLSDYLDHEAMFDEYPDMRDIPVTYAPDNEWRGGFYSPPGPNSQRGITISKDAYSTNPDAFMKLLLHEGQHDIQHHENFVPGANPRYALHNMKNEIRDGAAGVNYVPGRMKPEDIEMARAMHDGFDALPDDVKAILARKAYMRNYGEVESRNVENRKDLPMFDVKPDLEPVKRKIIEMYERDYPNNSYPWMDDVRRNPLAYSDVIGDRRVFEATRGRRNRQNLPSYTQDHDDDWTIVPNAGFTRNQEAYQHTLDEALWEQKRKAATGKAEGGSVSALDELMGMLEGAQ